MAVAGLSLKADTIRLVLAALRQAIMVEPEPLHERTRSYCAAVAPTGGPVVQPLVPRAAAPDSSEVVVMESGDSGLSTTDGASTSGQRPQHRPVTYSELLRYTPRTHRWLFYASTFFSMIKAGFGGQTAS